jgi:hypothetical protein
MDPKIVCYALVDHLGLVKRDLQNAYVGTEKEMRGIHDNMAYARGRNVRVAALVEVTPGWVPAVDSTVLLNLIDEHVKAARSPDQIHGMLEIREMVASYLKK